MNGSIDDRRVFRIARRIFAGAEQFGNAFYHVISDKSVSVVFTLDSNKTDEMMGWMDAMLSKPGELGAIAKRHKLMHVKNAVDPVKAGGENAMTFPLVFSGVTGCDLAGFIEEVKQKYGCDEIKG